MEENAKEIVRNILEFLAILVPGVLVYAVLLYRVPNLVGRFTPPANIKHRSHDSGASGEPAGEKRDLSIFFVVLQVYVLGYVVFGFSGIFDLVPPLNRLPLLSNVIMRKAGIAAYSELRTQFQTNAPAATTVPVTLKDGSDDDLCDIAMAYIRLRDKTISHELDSLRVESRTCRSLSFFCAVLACLALYFRQRFVSRWKWMTFGW